MAGKGPDSIPGGTRRPQDQTLGPGSDAQDHSVADLGLSLDSQDMSSQATKPHGRESAECETDKGLLEAYWESVEIGLHESWF